MSILLLMDDDGLPFPRSLFASGEQGIWLDPSDFSTLFQDAAGTIPVTAYGQPVGMVVDKSGNGNNLILTGATLHQDSDGSSLIAYDGSAHSRTNAAINLSATDEISIFMGFKGTYSGTTQFLAESNINAASSNGTFTVGRNLAAAGTLLAKSVQTSARGTSRVRAAADGGDSSVVAEILDISGASAGEVVNLRVNNTQASSFDGTTAGTGNFGNHTIYFGARNNGASLQFYGGLYQTIIVGRRVTTSEFYKAKEFTRGKTGYSPLSIMRNQTVDILLVAGQSNAEGRGSSASSPVVKPGYGGFFNGSSLTPLNDPVGGASSGSAWTSYANAWRTLTGRSLVVVEAAHSGSGLIAGVGAGDWSPSGAYRSAAVSAVNSARSYLGGISGVTVGDTYLAWLQGEQEGDAYNGTTITDAIYQASLEQLFAYLNANITGLGAILVSALGAPTDGVNGANWTLIRNAQAAAVANVAGSYIAFSGAVNFPAEGKMLDRLHYNQIGLTQIGAALATYADGL